MKITICGLAGTGTTSVGKVLSERLGFDFVSGGTIFRKMAKDKGLTLGEFEELSKKDEKYDKELDQGIAEYGKDNKDFIFESRLAWYFISDSIKIKLDCGFDERVRRVAQRDKIDFEQAKDETIARENAIRMRYKEYYGIEDFIDDKNFDFVVDATEIGIDEVVGKIEEYIKNLKNR